jgi:GTPase SAR1 family protein
VFRTQLFYIISTPNPDIALQIGILYFDTDPISTLNLRHFRRANGALIVYDTTNPDTFEKAVNKWLPDLEVPFPPNQPIYNQRCRLFVASQRHLHICYIKFAQSPFFKFPAFVSISPSGVTALDVSQKYKDEDNDAIMSTIMLVGNKCDMVTTSGVSEADHNAAIAQHSLLGNRTSAKSGLDVDKAFTELIVSIYENDKKSKQESNVGNGGKDGGLDLNRTKTHMNKKNMACC